MRIAHGIWLFLAAAALVLSFQNCSPFSLSQDVRDSFSRIEGRYGDTLFTEVYLQLGDCPSSSSRIQAVITRDPVSRRSRLERENCRELAEFKPVEAERIEQSGEPVRVISEGRLFEPRDVASPVHVFCRQGQTTLTVSAQGMLRLSPNANSPLIDLERVNRVPISPLLGRVFESQGSTLRIDAEPEASGLRAARLKQGDSPEQVFSCAVQEPEAQAANPMTALFENQSDGSFFLLSDQASSESGVWIRRSVGLKMAQVRVSRITSTEIAQGIVIPGDTEADHLLVGLAPPTGAQPSAGAPSQTCLVRFSDPAQCVARLVSDLDPARLTALAGGPEHLALIRRRTTAVRTLRTDATCLADPTTRCALNLARAVSELAMVAGAVISPEDRLAAFTELALAADRLVALESRSSLSSIPQEAFYAVTRAVQDVLRSGASPQASAGALRAFVVRRADQVEGFLELARTRLASSQDLTDTTPLLITADLQVALSALRWDQAAIPFATVNSVLDGLLNRQAQSLWSGCSGGAIGGLPVSNPSACLQSTAATLGLMTALRLSYELQCAQPTGDAFARCNRQSAGHLRALAHLGHAVRASPDGSGLQLMNYAPASNTQAASNSPLAWSQALTAEIEGHRSLTVFSVAGSALIDIGFVNGAQPAPQASVSDRLLRSSDFVGAPADARILQDWLSLSRAVERLISGVRGPGQPSL